jgi:hypothetical protein
MLAATRLADIVVLQPSTLFSGPSWMGKANVIGVWTSIRQSQAFLNHLPSILHVRAVGMVSLGVNRPPIVSALPPKTTKPRIEFRTNLATVAIKALWRRPLPFSSVDIVPSRH